MHHGPTIARFPVFPLAGPSLTPGSCHLYEVQAVPFTGAIVPMHLHNNLERILPKYSVSSINLVQRCIT